MPGGWISRSVPRAPGPEGRDFAAGVDTLDKNRIGLDRTSKLGESPDRRLQARLPARAPAPLSARPQGGAHSLTAQLAQYVTRVKLFL